MIEAEVSKISLKLIQGLQKALLNSQRFHPVLVDRIITPKLFDAGSITLRSDGFPYQVEAVPSMRVRGDHAGQAPYYLIKLSEGDLAYAALYPYGKITRGRRIYIESYLNGFKKPEIDNFLSVSIASAIISRLSGDCGKL